MNRGRKAVTAAEQDVLAGNGRYRRRYCYLQHSGVTAGIKRQARRRERRDAKSAVRLEGRQD